MRSLSYVKYDFLHIAYIFTGDLLYPRSFFTLCIKKVLTTTFSIFYFFLDGGRRVKQKHEEDFCFVVDFSIQSIGYSQNPFLNVVVFICESERNISHYLLFPKWRRHNMKRQHAIRTCSTSCRSRRWHLVRRADGVASAAPFKEEPRASICHIYAVGRKHRLVFILCHLFPPWIFI